jgi:S1-C subfamily serine protease
VLAVGFFNETQSPRFAFRGTGFVAGDGNLLVTCAHVVDSDIQPGNEGRLVVLSSNGKGAGQIRRAEVLEVDKVHDLTVLRFDGKPLPALDLGKAASVREGQSVAFMGFPLGGALGFAPVTHRGMVSSITNVALPSPTAKQLDERSISRLREGAFEMLQLDATAYPGNSGGPLFDAETGEVVGVVNMVTLKGTRESALTHPSGISYAIPVEFVLQLHALLVHK